MAAPKLLSIYLNDHLAGADAAIAVAARSKGSNGSNAVGRYLGRLIRELEEDRATLESIMDRVGARPDVVKRAAVRLAEKAGRLKLNGRLLAYSPLSRLLELEGLCLGVEGKLSLWRSLRELQPKLIDLAGFDFDALEARARTQREELEALRVRAAKTALVSN